MENKPCQVLGLGQYLVHSKNLGPPSRVFLSVLVNSYSSNTSVCCFSTCVLTELVSVIKCVFMDLFCSQGGDEA